MDIFLDNFWWMGINVGLAALGLIFAFAFLRSKSYFLKFIFFVFWVLFVPNTIYIITDLQHLPKQFFSVDILFKILLTIQYFVLIALGVVMYIFSIYLIELFFQKRKKDQKNSGLFVFLFNFLIAFAVAIGKVQRTNSWDIFTDPFLVFSDFYSTAASYQTMLFVIVFGLILNILYFYVIKFFKKDLNKIIKY